MSSIIINNPSGREFGIIEDILEIINRGNNMLNNDSISKKFPSTLLKDIGHRVHIYEDDGKWFVWLNTELDDFDGLCIGYRATYNKAVERAVKVVETVEELLQGRPCPFM